MKLAEALSIVQKTSAELPVFTTILVCGSTPLHLQNYLAAHLQLARPDRKIRVTAGLFGDVAGTLENIDKAEAQSVALVIEWSDLDARLGYRQLGGWGQKRLGNSVEAVEAMLARIEDAVRGVPAAVPVAISLPTLPLVPAFHTAGWHASVIELALERLISEFGVRVASKRNIRVVNRHKLEAQSAPASRYDFRSDLNAGFPYSLGHADVLAGALADLIAAPTPKKGLITDLDDTFWGGLVGEVGHENVGWDLASHNQMHGLYQQSLGALADHGVLIAIASKNSPEVVQRALSRTDLVIAKEKIFPIEVHWEAKSGSVGRILQAWNIAADNVVFVDDSLMELEEVRAAHPGIECLQFPKNDYAEGLALLHRLRDLFGKPELAAEDTFRLESIRAGQELARSNGDAGKAETFLANLAAKLTLEYNPPPEDKRVVELVNKTNQFNLNGVRYTEVEWQRRLREPGSFALAVSYADKFGPLGKVAVLAGKKQGSFLNLWTWVMSCRAFSRRIEHACISDLFRHFGVERIVFEFKATAKNGPIAEFLTQFSESAIAPLSISRSAFETKCPALYHEILENELIEKHG